MRALVSGLLCAVLIGAIGCGDRVVTRKAEKARAEPTVAIPTPLISTVPSVYYEPPPLTRDEKIAAAKRLCATGECLPTNNEWESLLVSATKSEKAALGKICLDAAKADVAKAQTVYRELKAFVPIIDLPLQCVPWEDKHMASIKSIKANMAGASDSYFSMLKLTADEIAGALTCQDQDQRLRSAARVKEALRVIPDQLRISSMQRDFCGLE